MWNEASAKPCTRILFLQLLLGVLLLGGVFLLAVNEDIAATQRTMVNTVNYVKEQCNRYSRIGLADESKSLMRIVESANILYGFTAVSPRYAMRMLRRTPILEA